MRSKFWAKALCVIVLSPICFALCFSEGAQAESSACNVLVRLLQGGTAGNGMNALPDALVKDVGSQLDPLPYTSYAVLDSRSQSLPLGHEGMFSLVGYDNQRHVLRVVPHNYSYDKVGITVMWNGPNNEELLSTKMRVANGKCVVLGTDSRNAATILTVKLECSGAKR